MPFFIHSVACIEFAVGQLPSCVHELSFSFEVSENIGTSFQTILKRDMLNLDGFSAFSADQKASDMSGAMRVFGTLDDIFHEAAAGDEVRRYFRARSISTIGTLALVAKDEEELSRNVINPLMAGWGTGASAITLQETEKPIAKAVILHVWTLARTSWARSLQPTLPMATTAPAGSAPSATSAATPTIETKIPKQLPAGKWTELVEHYNQVTVAGRPRQFPTRELLGAEVILARVYHERFVTHLYTPLLLGELLQHRSFTASGEINPLAAKQNKKPVPLALNEDRELVESDDPSWTPRSVLSVIDGINACRWAYILMQMGEEHEIHSFCDWMQQRARSRTDKMEQMVSFWHASMWKVAMAMRAGDTFGQATLTVQQDLEAFHEAMLKEPSLKNNKTRLPPKSELPTKGDGKSSKGQFGKQGKGSSSVRIHPYGRGRQHEQQYWGSWSNRSNTSNYWQRDPPSNTWQSWNDRYNK